MQTPWSFQIHVERSLGTDICIVYVQIVISGIEMARTKITQTSPDSVGIRYWEEVLYVPLCHATTQIGIEVMGQGSRGKYHCQLSGVILVSDLVVEMGGILMMRQPLRRTFLGFKATAISLVSFHFILV